MIIKGRAEDSVKEYMKKYGNNNFNKVIDELVKEDVGKSNFELWSVYRKGIIHSIHSSFLKYEGVSFESCAVFGIGEGADIDISFLLSKFKAVDLYDYDENALLKLKTNYQLSHEELDRINFTKVNFISNFENYESLAVEFLTGKINEKKFNKKLIQLGNENLMNLELSSLIEGRYDLVICIGVHSQLGLTDELYKLIKTRSLESKYDKFIQYYQKNASLMLNKLILSSIKKNGVAVIGYDIYEISPRNQGVSFFDVRDRLYKYTELGDDNKILNEVVNYPAVNGAKEGYLDFVQKNKHMFNSWMWEYNKLKYYLLFVVFTQK